MVEDEKTTMRSLARADDNREAAVELARGASRHLAIFTQDLEPLILDQADFVSAVKELALKSKFSRIRILVKDSNRAVKEGHRLMNLAQRLSSYIEVRRLSGDYANIAEAFIIADERGLLYRPLASRFEGIADTNDPFQAREKLHQFDEMWERSDPDPELRRLGI
jgi:hypothetical protein